MDDLDLLNARRREYLNLAFLALFIAGVIGVEAFFLPWWAWFISLFFHIGVVASLYSYWSWRDARIVIQRHRASTYLP